MYLFNKYCIEYVHLQKRDATYGIGTGLILAAFIVAALIVFASAKRKQNARNFVQQQQQQQEETTISQSHGQTNHSSGTEVRSPPIAHLSNRDENPNDYVPPYSATPDEKNDLGYYDQEGKFHPSTGNSRLVSPPPLLYTR